MISSLCTYISYWCNNVLTDNHNILVTSVQFSSVQFSRSVVSDSLLPHEASLSITISQSSLKLMSIESVMPSSHLILCRPLLLLPPNPPSIRVFSTESTLRMRWPKYWSFSFSIIPSKEIPGLISNKYFFHPYIWASTRVTLIWAVNWVQDWSTCPSFCN